MKLPFAALLSALLVGSGAAYYLSVHGSNLVENGPVARALEDHLKNSKVRTFSYSRLATEPFTDVVVFEPFTSRQQMCGAIGLRGWGCIRLTPYQVHSHHYFVVYLRHTEVVHHEYQSIELGRFIGLSNGFRMRGDFSDFNVTRNYSLRDEQGRPQVLFTARSTALIAPIAPSSAP